MDGTGMLQYQFSKLGLKGPEAGSRTAGLFRPSEKSLHRTEGFWSACIWLNCDWGSSPISTERGTLCEEAGLKPFLRVILDSLIVGLKKPDPKLFQLALEGVKGTAADTAFVGDSFERDIIPAKALGMTTFWNDERKKAAFPPDPSKVDHILHSLEDLRV